MLKRLIVAGLIASLPLALAAAGKPPKLPDTPAMTTFRCTAGAACPSVADTVRDDGATYGNDLARIASSGFYNFSIQLSDSRSVTLDLRNPIEPAACIAAGNCNPNRDLVVGGNLVLATASIAIKPLVGSGLSELSGLLWGMNCTDRYSAKVHYSFTLPSANGHWGFNFNSADYPVTNDAFIMRVTNQQWIVESPGQIGELLSWAHSGLRRPQSGPSHEGRYHAIFQFTIDAASLPSPSVGCS